MRGRDYFARDVHSYPRAESSSTADFRPRALRRTVAGLEAPVSHHDELKCMFTRAGQA